ncbi:Mu subunit [Entamoeba marina]
MATESLCVLNSTGDVLLSKMNSIHERCVEHYISKGLQSYEISFEYCGGKICSSTPIITARIDEFVTALKDVCGNLTEAAVRKEIIRAREVADEHVEYGAMKSVVISTLSNTASVFVEHVETLSKNGKINGIINIKSAFPMNMSFYLTNMCQGTLGLDSCRFERGSQKIFAYQSEAHTIPFSVNAKSRLVGRALVISVKVKQKSVGKCWIIAKKPPGIENIVVTNGDIVTKQDLVRWRVQNGEMKLYYDTDSKPRLTDIPFISVEFEAEDTIASNCNIQKISLERSDVTLYIKRATVQGNWTEELC